MKIYSKSPVNLSDNKPQGKTFKCCECKQVLETERFYTPMLNTARKSPTCDLCVQLERREQHGGDLEVLRSVYGFYAPTRYKQGTRYIGDHTNG